MSNSHQGTFKTGAVLNDKWIVMELLGKGGMGEVYRVHQLNLKRDIALKIISQKFLEEIEEDEYEAETGLDRFRREVQVMAQIRHPNVLQVYDYGVLSFKKGEKELTREYIAMEYIPGATLRTTMSTEGFSPDEDRAREWMSSFLLPLLDGISALHEQGIIHRDLKPENVLIDGNIPKIADFGLARSHSLKSVTQSVDMRGTPPYMSPEHFLDLKRTDHRTDVYALGKILYEAISGKMTSDEIPFRQARLKSPESPFFEQLDGIIQQATAEDKNQRYSSVGAMKDALEALLENGRQSGIPRARAAPATIRPFYKGWVFTIVVLLVLGALLSIGFLSFKKMDRAPVKLRQDSTTHGNHGASSTKAGDSSSDSPAGLIPGSIIQGKDHAMLRLVPKGTYATPRGADPGAGTPIEAFYMDETQVTNYQFVDFLNRNLPRIKVENGLVRGDGKIWLMLGEVKKGYNPIMYEGGSFRIHGSEHAACPVLRVTAFGASAYAQFFGRRLPTEEEWLYVAAGAEAPTTSSMLPVPSPVMLSKPTAYGVRGLNESIGEWVVHGVDFAVAGHLWSDAEKPEGAPSAIRRYPWEAFEEVGFRTALNVSNRDQ